MKYCDSQTAITAALTSSLIAAYCAFRSSSGTSTRAAVTLTSLTVRLLNFMTAPPIGSIACVARRVVLAVRIDAQRQLHPALAYPAPEPRRIAEHHGIGRHVPRHDGPCADEGILAESGAADDRRVRAYRRSSLDERIPILVLALDVAAGIDDVREHHRRTAENVVLEH